MHKRTLAMIGLAASVPAGLTLLRSGTASSAWTAVAYAESDSDDAPPRMPGFPPGMHHRPMDPGGGDPILPLPFILRDLTPEQRTEVRSILENQRQQLEPLMQRLRSASEALTDALLAADAPAASALAQDTVQVSLLRQQLLDQELAMALAVRQVLTPEQLASASQRLKEMRDLAPEGADGPWKDGPPSAR